MYRSRAVTANNNNNNNNSSSSANDDAKNKVRRGTTTTAAPASGSAASTAAKTASSSAAAAKTSSSAPATLNRGASASSSSRPSTAAAASSSSGVGSAANSSSALARKPRPAAATVSTPAPTVRKPSVPSTTVTSKSTTHVSPKTPASATAAALTSSSSAAAKTPRTPAVGGNTTSTSSRPVSNTNNSLSRRPSGKTSTTPIQNLVSPRGSIKAVRSNSVSDGGSGGSRMIYAMISPVAGGGGSGGKNANRMSMERQLSISSPRTSTERQQLVLDSGPTSIESRGSSIQSPTTDSEGTLGPMSPLNLSDHGQTMFTNPHEEKPILTAAALGEKKKSEEDIGMVSATSTDTEGTKSSNISSMEASSSGSVATLTTKNKTSIPQRIPNLSNLPKAPEKNTVAHKLPEKLNNNVSKLPQRTGKTPQKLLDEPINSIQVTVPLAVQPTEVGDSSIKDKSEQLQNQSKSDEQLNEPIIPDTVINEVTESPALSVAALRAQFSRNNSNSAPPSASSKVTPPSSISKIPQSTSGKLTSNSTNSNNQKRPTRVTPPQSISPRELALIRSNRISTKIVDISKQIAKAQMKKEEELYAFKVQQLQQQLEQFQHMSPADESMDVNIGEEVEPRLQRNKFLEDDRRRNSYNAESVPEKEKAPDRFPSSLAMINHRPLPSIPSSSSADLLSTDNLLLDQMPGRQSSPLPSQRSFSAKRVPSMDSSSSSKRVSPILQLSPANNRLSFSESNLMQVNELSLNYSEDNDKLVNGDDVSVVSSIGSISTYNPKRFASPTSLLSHGMKSDVSDSVPFDDPARLQFPAKKATATKLVKVDEGHHLVASSSSSDAEQFKVVQSLSLEKHHLLKQSPNAEFSVLSGLDSYSLSETDDSSKSLVVSPSLSRQSSVFDMLGKSTNSSNRNSGNRQQFSNPISSKRPDSLGDVSKLTDDTSVHFNHDDILTTGTQYSPMEDQYSVGIAERPASVNNNNNTSKNNIRTSGSHQDRVNRAPSQNQQQKSPQSSDFFRPILDDIKTTSNPNAPLQALNVSEAFRDSIVDDIEQDAVSVDFKFPKTIEKAQAPSVDTVPIFCPPAISDPSISTDIIGSHIITKKQRESQRKSMFDQERAKYDNVKHLFRRFKAIGNQWESAQTEISSTDDGVCLVIILPYLFQLDVKLVPATMFAKSLFSFQKFRMNLFALNCVADASAIVDSTSRPDSIGSASGPKSAGTKGSGPKSPIKKFKKMENRMTYEYTLDSAPQSSADAAAVYVENETGGSDKKDKSQDRDSNTSKSTLKNTWSKSHENDSTSAGSSTATKSRQRGRPGDDVSVLTSSILSGGEVEFDDTNSEDDLEVQKYDTIKVELHANRHIFSKEKRVTDENTEFFGEYKLEGWNASLNHRHVTHRYDKETGLLMVFIDRIRPREVDLSQYMKAADDNSSQLRSITKRGRYHFPGDVQLDNEGKLSPVSRKRQSNGNGGDNDSVTSSKSTRSNMKSLGNNTTAGMGSNRERSFPRGLADDKARNSGVFSVQSGKFNEQDRSAGSPFQAVKKHRRGGGESNSTVRSTGSVHSLNSASHSVQSSPSSSPATSLVQSFIGTKTYEI